MTNFLLFLLLFGVVVFIHELGHFTIAKLSGVFVERFAIGFGPALFKFRKGETEYALCALPLGGYVKMRGESADPEQSEQERLDPRSFSNASVKARLAIAAMGPTSNLILPIVLFTLMYLIGVPIVTTKVGTVLPQSAAENAGLRAGDRVEAVNGQPIWKWEDLDRIIQNNPDQRLELRVTRHDGKSEVIAVTPKKELGVNRFGEEAWMGRIGVSPYPSPATIGVISPKTPAGKAGLKPGDVIVAVNETPVDFYWQLEAWAEGAKPGKATLQVRRYASPIESERFEVLDVTLQKPKAGSLTSLGIEPAEMYVREVVSDSVAAEIGILPGDKLIAINGIPLSSWTEFQTRVSENQGDSIALQIQRDGELKKFEFVPRSVKSKNPFTKTPTTRRQLGVLSASALPVIPERGTERYLNPFKALAQGFLQTLDLTATTIHGLYLVFTGQVALQKSLGGPITIFFLAGGSYESGGWISFFHMMAALSIALGIINFVPIPLLDGGHLLFYTLEALRGKPVSLRIQAMAQHVGLVIIISLIVLTFVVDIQRYFLESLKSFFQ